MAAQWTKVRFPRLRTTHPENSMALRVLKIIAKFFLQRLQQRAVKKVITSYLVPGLHKKFSKSLKFGTPKITNFELSEILNNF